MQERTSIEAIVMAGDHISDALDKLPEGPSGYAGGGKVAGYVADLVRDTFGSYMPTQPSDVEIADVTPTGNGARYVVNVTGFIRKMSEQRAIQEALPGKINMATDEVHVESVEKISDREVRNTWQVTLKVNPKDTFLDRDREGVSRLRR